LKYWDGSSNILTWLSNLPGCDTGYFPLKIEYNNKLYIICDNAGNLAIYDNTTTLPNYFTTPSINGCNELRSLTEYNGKIYVYCFNLGDVYVYDINSNTWGATGYSSHGSPSKEIIEYNNNLYIFSTDNRAYIYTP